LIAGPPPLPASAWAALLLALGTGSLDGSADVMPKGV
jgi:hypothetical protein